MSAIFNLSGMILLFLENGDTIFASLGSSRILGEIRERRNRFRGDGKSAQEGVANKEKRHKVERDRDRERDREKRESERVRPEKRARERR